MTLDVVATSDLFCEEETMRDHESRLAFFWWFWWMMGQLVWETGDKTRS